MLSQTLKKLKKVIVKSIKSTDIPWSSQLKKHDWGKYNREKTVSANEHFSFNPEIRFIVNVNISWWPWNCWMSFQSGFLMICSVSAVRFGRSGGSRSRGEGGGGSWRDEAKDGVSSAGRRWRELPYSWILEVPAPNTGSLWMDGDTDKRTSRYFYSCQQTRSKLSCSHQTTTRAPNVD